MKIMVIDRYENHFTSVEMDTIPRKDEILYFTIKGAEFSFVVTQVRYSIRGDYQDMSTTGTDVLLQVSEGLRVE